MARDVLLVTTSLIIVLLIIVGCSSDKCVHEVTSPINMMRILPATEPSEEFAYVDLAGLEAGRSDTLYKFVSETMDFNHFGITPEMVDSYAASDEVSLFKGHFDFDGIKSKLAEYEYESIIYEGTELLESAHIDFSHDSFAFLDTFVIHGPPQPVRECILVIQEMQDSLYDNQDFTDIVTRLSKGTLIQCEEHRFRQKYEYDGLQIAGTSTWAKNQDTISFEGILKFEDADTAEAMMNHIMTDMEGEGHTNWSNIIVKQNGEYVRVTAEQPMSAFIPSYPSVN